MQRYEQICHKGCIQITDVSTQIVILTFCKMKRVRIVCFRPLIGTAPNFEGKNS